VKSELTANKIQFDELMDRLRAYIRLRINSGEFTERSLARVLRISQPHLHNMLKGVRRINVELGDRLMVKFRISVLDLITEEEMWSFCDDKNPEWVHEVMKRKPAGRTSERVNDPRAPWRTGSD
jgi:plasmid maintenance system antidote protein VapI